MAKKRMMVHIDAAPETVFQMFIDDRTGPVDDPPKTTQWLPVTQGPMRQGSLYKTVRRHEGHTCGARITISAFVENELLEEIVESFCAVEGRSSRIRRRYELRRGADPGTTLVVEVEQRLPPLRRVVYALAASTWDAGLPHSLGVIKFEAERRSRLEAH